MENRSDNSTIKFQFQKNIIRKVKIHLWKSSETRKIRQKNDNGFSMGISYTNFYQRASWQYSVNWINDVQMLPWLTKNGAELKLKLEEKAIQLVYFAVNDRPESVEGTTTLLVAVY